jgi:hypothetical protein
LRRLVARRRDGLFWGVGRAKWQRRAPTALKKIKTLKKSKTSAATVFEIFKSIM